MKRRATQPNNNWNDEESRFSRKLFNKSDKVADTLKTQIKVDDEDDLERKPAWVDEDDQNFGASNNDTNITNVKSKALYVDKLKQKYETLMGTPRWAKLKKVDPEKSDVDDTVQQRIGHLHKGKSEGLKKDYLGIRKYSQINYSTRNEGPYINCIEFHPKSTVALVAGQSGIVSLFSVGQEVSNKLHSFEIMRWNISRAYFSPSGNEAYISSHTRNTYCIYDLIKAKSDMVQLPEKVKRAKIFKLSPDGKYIAVADGYDEAFIICTASKELLRVLKHNSTITSMTFSHDSKQLYSYGLQGEITIWDLSTYRSVKKFYDQGCVKASLIECSPCGRLLATGSREGIVNIYQTANLNSSEPLPHKTISNLTTSITSLKFNPTTEILALASNKLQNAAKLVHIPSYHIFMNFPKQNETLSQVSVLNFSPNSGYMALGNEKYRALLFRLKYFKNY